MARAALDALGYTGLHEPPQHNRAVLDARLWFEYAHDDVEMACDMSGIDRDLITETVLRVPASYMQEGGDAEGGRGDVATAQ